MGIGPLSPTVTPDPQPSFPSTLELRLLLVHMHDAGHVRMHGADVTEVAFAGKSMLELVVGIQAFRGKTLVVAGHGMRRFVVIGPDDLGAGCDRDFLRPVCELCDIDIDGRRGRSRRCENRRHGERCAQSQREHGTSAKQPGGVAIKSVVHRTVLVCMRNVQIARPAAVCNASSTYVLDATAHPESQSGFTNGSYANQLSSGVSISASSCRPRATVSWRVPSSLPSSPAGTVTGPGSPIPACPGVGSG